MYERTDQARAVATYERLVADFGDQRDVAIEARARLAALQPTTVRGPAERLITNDRTLGGVGAPRWSPNGRYVIGMRLRGSEFDGDGLYLLTVDNAGGRVVFERAPGFSVGFWGFSPDSQRFAAMMPEAVPQSVMARIIRGEIESALVAAPGVLVVGSVAAGATPTVVDIPEMAGVNAFEPFTNPLAWSPDGRWLAVAMPVSPVRTHEIQILNVATGELRSLGFRAAGSFDLTWSPDGRDVLVHAGTSSAQELRLITVATGEVRSLPLPGAPGARLRVSGWTDNRHVQVRHIDPQVPEAEDTFLLSVDSGASRRTCTGQAFALAGTGGTPGATSDICREVTSDGAQQVVWQQASKRLVVRNLSTGDERPLTSGSGEEYYGSLSPDGRVEVFVSNRDGRWGLYAAEIAGAPVATPVRLSTFEDMPTGFSLVRWTSDGFIANLGYNESNIIRVDVDATGRATGNAERLTQDGILNHTPAISPDGRRIAYWSRHGSRFGLAVMDSDGSNERLLFEALSDPGGLPPSWRSTSEVIFTIPAWPQPVNFVEPPPGTPATRTLMSLNVVTGQASPIAELNDWRWWQAQPKYVAALNEILYVDDGFRTLMARSLVDGRRRVVVTFDGEAEVDSFLASPDGGKVVYQLAQRYSSGRACFSREPRPVQRVDDMITSCEIGLLNPATGERAVLATPRTPTAFTAWSPDGRLLQTGRRQKQVMDTTTAALQTLFEQNGRLNVDGPASWSPDGTFILLSDQTQRFEWRQWSGVR